ncbi:MAG: hypothetical protein DRG20_00970 [Deltaproteobacteria bacterium]|nr:MAG: hypothetical protein DRG20_00970 [Deltaproteobacteria bacterium]
MQLQESPIQNYKPIWADDLPNLPDDELIFQYVFHYPYAYWQHQLGYIEDDIVDELTKRKLLNKAEQVFNYCYQAFKEKTKELLNEQKINSRTS